MEDRTLLMLAITTSIIGIIILWFACAHHEPPVFGLNDVTDELMGKVVTVNGTLDTVNVYDTVVVAGFEGSELTLFGFTSNIPKIEVGDFVTVTGEIKEYEGTLEIVPNQPKNIIVAKARSVKTKTGDTNQEKHVELQPEELREQNQEPVIMDLKKVNSELIGKTLTVRGVLKRVKVYDTIVIGEFRGSDLKLFGFVDNLPVLKEFDLITVTGEVKEYKGALEIVPSKAGDVLIGSRKD